MNPAQFKEEDSQSESHHEDKSKRHKSSFKVIRELVNARKQAYSLKVFKPTSKGSAEVNTCPSVYFKEERVGNKHAFYIMHNLYHKNILSLKVLSKNKMSEDPSSIAAFVEPYDGKLWSICEPKECADRVNQIFSPSLQALFRQIAIGIDFLRMNGQYHGNLSWTTTLYSGNTVKLAGFEMNDSEDPAWNDWLCFIRMLEEFSERVRQLNELSSIHYCTDVIDSLIATLRALDRASLSTIREIALKHPFFWDIVERVDFFALDISLKLSDKNFMRSVESSGVWHKSWDKNGTPSFLALVKAMNNHRDAEERKRHRRETGSNKKIHYDGNSLGDYVKCVCGAYTHWKQIKVNVDQIVCENHPTIHIDMKRLVGP